MQSGGALPKFHEQTSPSGQRHVTAPEGSRQRVRNATLHPSPALTSSTTH